MTGKISLRAQSDHLNWLANLADRLQPEAIRRKLLTEREAPLRAQQTAALIGTIRWLLKHEDAIKRFLPHAEEIDRLLAMEPEVRAAIMDHGPAVAALAVEAAAREVLGREGGGK